MATLDTGITATVEPIHVDEGKPVTFKTEFTGELCGETIGFYHDDPHTIYTAGGGSWTRIEALEYVSLITLAVNASLEKNG